MRQIDYREALREGLDEELARDPNVFIMGEEVAEYNGAYKVTQGLWEEWGARRVIDTPTPEGGVVGLGREHPPELVGLRLAEALPLKFAGDGIGADLVELVDGHEQGGLAVLGAERPGHASENASVVEPNLVVLESQGRQAR